MLLLSATKFVPRSLPVAPTHETKKGVHDAASMSLVRPIGTNRAEATSRVSAL